MGEEVSIYDECFQSKFCYGNPLGCIEGKNCDILATVTLVNSSKHVIIDLYKENLENDQYVAVGFSGDKSMGDDLVFMSSPSEKMLMKGWNQPRTGPPEDITGITELDYSQDNTAGFFHCQFELEKILTFAKAGSGEQVTVDFSQPRHILLATGQMQNKRISYHGRNSRAVSEDSVIVTAFVKDEQFESTTEGSIWNLFVLISPFNPK